MIDNSNMERYGRDLAWSRIMRKPGVLQQPTATTSIVRKPGFEYLRMSDLDTTPICHLCGFPIFLCEASKDSIATKPYTYTKNVAARLVLPSYLIQHSGNEEEHPNNWVCLADMQDIKKVKIYETEEEYVLWVEDMWKAHWAQCPRRK